MRRFVGALLTASLMVLCPWGTVQADILTVVPEKSLVAVISGSPDGMQEHMRRMAAQLSDAALPEDFLLDEVLENFGLYRKAGLDADGNRTEAKRVTAMDRKGPMAVVFVTPALDIPGMPLGLVVRVADYRKMLQEMAAVASLTDVPLPVEVTVDGTDVVKGEKRSFFAARLGEYAVVADAEYVVKTFKAEAQKSLAVSGIAALRNACLVNDVVLYLNTDEMMRTFGPQIKTFKDTMQQQIKNQPQGAGAPVEPGKAAQMLGAEMDMMVSALSQTDSVCTGVKFGVEGARAESFAQVLPGTTLARMAARVKPVGLGLLLTLDGPALGASGWHVDPESLKEMIRFLEDLLVKGAGAEKEGENKDFLESYRKVMEAASGEGAFVWAAPGEGKGLLRFIYLIALKPGVDIRSFLKDYVEKSMGFANVFGGPVKFEIGFEENVETHRGCAVDRITVTFRKNPDAPEPMNPEADVMGMIETIYGPKLVAYVTQAADTLIYSAGYPTSDALKAQVDKVLDHRSGDYVQSAAYREAVKGLPAGRSGVMTFSLAEMVKTFVSEFVRRQDPDAENQLKTLKFDSPSGVGMSFGPAEKGIAVYLNVPMQEMQNLKKLIGQMGPPRGRRGPGRGRAGVGGPPAQ